MSARECIFCLIARRDLPAAIVYEDDMVVAFDDASPQAPVHTLVIPREHFESLQYTVPDEVLSALLRAVREVATVKGIDASGYRVIANAGLDSNQTVRHLHLHVMGGAAMSHGMVNFREPEGRA